MQLILSLFLCWNEYFAGSLVSLLWRLCYVKGLQLLKLIKSSVVDVIKVILCYAARLMQYAAGDGVTLRTYLRR